MNANKKFGWTEKTILGAVFAPLGLIFLVLGVALWFFKAGNDPEDPVVFLAVFGGMGAIFLLIGSTFLLADAKQRNDKRRVYEEGYYVMAKIAGVQPYVNGKTGGTIYRMVECHYADPDTGVTHIYFSRYLSFDPTDLFTAREVPVYIDRNNEKRFFVDIDAVLPPVAMHRS